SSNARIEGNLISRAGIDAISGIDKIKGGSWSTGLHATSNTIKDSGVRLEGNTIVSLPRRSFAAINVGTHSVVSWNKIDNAGYGGIRVRRDSTVESNSLFNACLVID